MATLKNLLFPNNKNNPKEGKQDIRVVLYTR